MDDRGERLLRASMAAADDDIERVIKETVSHLLSRMMTFIETAEDLGKGMPFESREIIVDQLYEELMTHGLALLLAGAYMQELYPDLMYAFQRKSFGEEC